MRRKNKMIVYELGWWYLDEESGKSDEQVIAVYSVSYTHLTLPTNSRV